MQFLGAIVVAFLVLGCVVLMVRDIATHGDRQAQAAAATVLLDGRAVEVHTITDKARGATYRMIYVDRGAVILPAIEPLVPVTVEGVTR
jgi:hypothetical protein